METKKKRKTLVVTMILAVVVAVIGVLSGDIGIMGNLMLIAVIIAVVPIFWYQYSSYTWVRGIETQFPNLVRDLADSRRSGMSFPESIKIATRANYGKLSAEVMHMHNKLSWGIPFIRVLEIFGERVKRSKLITEAVTIIKESYKSGGDIASTLDSISQDMVLLKDAEAERVSIVRQHVMIMYGIFFMFVGISIMIIFVMVPMIQTQPSASTGTFGFAFSDPCEGISIFPCNLFYLVGGLLGVPEGIANYYISLFFFVVVIQGIFTGLIAGQLGENSVVAGSKHSLIMAFAGIGIFIFIAKAGILPI